MSKKKFRTLLNKFILFFHFQIFEVKKKSLFTLNKH